MINIFSCSLTYLTCLTVDRAVLSHSVQAHDCFTRVIATPRRILQTFCVLMGAGGCQHLSAKNHR